MAGLAEPAGQQCVVIEWLDSGAGNLTKNGAGTLTLNGANSLTGSFNLAGGALALGAGGSLSPTGAITLGVGTSLIFRRPPTRPSARWPASAVRSTWAATR
jgi:autotransporter-associated beta strand protein